MPSEGTAFLLGYRADKFVSPVEGRPDDQYLLATISAFEPDTRTPEPTTVRNGDDGSRGHRKTVSNPPSSAEIRFLSAGQFVGTARRQLLKARKHSGMGGLPRIERDALAEIP